LSALSYDLLRNCTRYNLDGPGFENRWGRDFPYQSRLAPTPTQPLVQWVVYLFPAIKATDAWRWSPCHLVPIIQKEYSYTTTYPLGLHGLS